MPRIFDNIEADQLPALEQTFSSHRSNRYYTLDFWRGVACLLVVVVHSTCYVHGDPAYVPPDRLSRVVLTVIKWMGMGVPMFFVISGYCITSACESIRPKPHAIRQYFLRRLRRIFPPYWIALNISLAAVAGVALAGFPAIFTDDIFPIPNPLTLSAWQWTGNISLTETWLHNFGGQNRNLFLGHAWSLCYEEQFYVVCGLALFLARRRFFQVMAGVSVLVAALQASHLAGWRPPVHGFFFDGLWLVFAAGVLVYYRAHYARGRWQVLVDVALCGSSLFMVILQWKAPAALGPELLTGFIFALVLSLLYRWDLPMARSPLTRPICWCGMMCYSLYLIHWPLVKAVSHLFYLGGVRGLWPTLFFTVPVCVVLSVGAAWGFHVLVERRFLNTPPMMPHRALALEGAAGKATDEKLHSDRDRAPQPGER